MNIGNDDNDNSEIAGLRFGYDWSGVFADITLLPEELNAEEKLGSIVAELLERYNKISTFWNDQSEPADEDVEAVENEIKQFVQNLYSPILRALVPSNSENYDPECLPEYLECYLYSKSVNLQIIESNGTPQVVRRDSLPPFTIYRVIPAIPSQEAELSSYSPSQIKVIERYRPWALKVSIHETVMFCKVNGAIHDCFDREYQALQKILDVDDSDGV